MTTHQRREKAILLIQQRRVELAERELHQLLAERPDDAWVHATIALCLVDRGKPAAAQVAARRAIALDPELDYPHKVLAVVLARAGRLAEARRTVGEAIRLDPYNVDHRALLSEIELATGRPEIALREADASLAVDPRHVRSLLARAAALVELGRAGEARDAAGHALQLDPTDDDAHRISGDALLHLGDAGAALDRYREALRLNPNGKQNRAGFLRALKARHRLYRLALRFLLFAGRRRVGVRVGVVLVLLLGRWLVEVVEREAPALRPFVLPAVLVLVGLLVLTWLADPLFTLLLRFDAAGRHVLTEPQRATSNYVVTLTLLLTAVVTTAVLDRSGATPVYVLLGGLIALPVSVALAYREADRWQLVKYAGGCAGLGALALLVSILRPGSGGGPNAGAILACLAYAAGCALSVLARPPGADPPDRLS